MIMTRSTDQTTPASSSGERLAFVFGAGSSRGALQAGALETLMEAGIVPDLVVGSSIGSLNAAWVAADPTLAAVRSLQQLYRETRFEDIFPGGMPAALLHLARREQSLFDNSGMVQIAAQQFHDRRLKELLLPCYVVATDIDNGELYVFGDDPDEQIVSALLSSAAILPLQPPFACYGRHFGDGGLRSALPLQTAADRGATAIIAFNILTQLQPPDSRSTPFHMLLHGADLVLRSQVDLTVDNFRLSNDMPFFVLNLRPDRYITMLDLDEVDRLIDQGREQARAALPQIYATIPMLGKTS